MTSPANDASPAPAQPVSILLVDDEPAVLQALSRALRSDQYEIHTALTGALALGQMELKRIDVVIADIQMPGMRGTELLARVAERWPDTSRIALTGGTDLSDAVAAINSGGIFRWIPKPWDVTDLRAKVQSAADRARKIQTARRRLQTAPRPSGGPETVPHIVKRFFKGEVIFREGSPGHHLHFIRAGKVELSIEQEGSRIVVETRKAGDCFGTIAPILDGTRTLTATAVEFTETFSMTQATITDLLNKNDPIIASILKSLAEQARHALVTLATSDPLVGPVQRAAHALDLMARAAPTLGAKAAGGRSPQAPVKLPLAEVIQTLNAVTGIVKANARALLDQMARLNLIVLDGGRHVLVKPGEIIAMMQNLGAGHGDSLTAALRAETEMMTIEELVEMLGVERAMIQRKMGQGELPDELWSFRKSETLRIIHDKGQDFFRKRKVKKVEDFDDIGDILFIDRDTLGLALSEMEVYQIATLLKPQEQDLRDRALGSLSSRMRSIVADTLSRMDSVDEVEVGLLEAELIDRIKAIKTDKGAAGKRDF